MSQTIIRVKSVYRYPGTSQAILAGGHLVTTGQVSVDVDGRVVGTGDMQMQLETIMRAIGAILEEAGADSKALTKLTIFTTDIAEFGRCFGDVHARFLEHPYPAITAVEVAALSDPGYLVEIDVQAYVA